MGWHKLKVKILKSETKNKKWMLLNKADSVSWNRQVLNLLGVTPSFACTFDQFISSIAIIYVNRLSRQFSNFISINKLIDVLSCGQSQKISRKENFKTKKMRSMFIFMCQKHNSIDNDHNTTVKFNLMQCWNLQISCIQCVISILLRIFHDFNKCRKTLDIPINGFPLRQHDEYQMTQDVAKEIVWN